MNLTYPTFKCGQHHVSRIQAVDEVGRECSGLFHRVDCSRRVRVGKVDTLERSHDLFPLFLSVWLNNGKSERCCPDHTRHLFFPDTREKRLASRFHASVFGFDRWGSDNSETFRGNRFGDKFRASVEPGLNLLGGGE